MEGAEEGREGRRGWGRGRRGTGGSREGGAQKHPPWQLPEQVGEREIHR